MVVGGRVDARGSNARLGGSQYLVGRGRRERPLVLEAVADPGRGDEPRPRAHGLLPRHGRCGARFRRFYRPRTVLRRRDGLHLQTLCSRGYTAARAAAGLHLRRGGGGGFPARSSQCRANAGFGIGAGKFVFALPGAYRRGAAWSFRITRARPGTTCRMRRLPWPSRGNLKCRRRRLPRASAHFRGVDRRFQQEGPGARRDGGGRLRPPSHRDSGYAGGGARVNVRIAVRGLSPCWGAGRFMSSSSRNGSPELLISWTSSPGAFKDADTVVVLPIYAASEEPIPCVTAERLAYLIQGPRVEYAPDFAAAVAAVTAPARLGRPDKPWRGQREPTGAADSGGA